MVKLGFRLFALPIFVARSLFLLSWRKSSPCEGVNRGSQKFNGDFSSFFLLVSFSQGFFDRSFFLSLGGEEEVFF